MRSNFIARMEHIRDHFVYDHARPDQMQKDGYLVKHLFDQNIIDRRTYESILAPSTVPAIPGNHSRHSSSSQRTQHSRHSHHRLEQVAEEEVVAGSSSRHQHRSDRARESNRDHHGSSSHKHKHRR